MKKLCMIFCVLLASSISLAKDRQGQLQDRGLIFDGWQDEGIIELAQELPVFRRMSTKDLHRLVDEKLATQVNCSSRNVASLKAKDECFKTLVEW